MLQSTGTVPRSVSPPSDAAELGSQSGGAPFAMEEDAHTPIAPPLPSQQDAAQAEAARALADVAGAFERGYTQWKEEVERGCVVDLQASMEQPCLQAATVLLASLSDAQVRQLSLQGTFLSGELKPQLPASPSFNMFAEEIVRASAMRGSTE